MGLRIIPEPDQHLLSIGDSVYFESGTGTVYCYDAVTGDKIWSVDLLKKFNAEISHGEWRNRCSLTAIICIALREERKIILLHSTVLQERQSGQVPETVSHLPIVHLSW